MAGQSCKRNSLCTFGASSWRYSGGGSLSGIGSGGFEKTWRSAALCCPRLLSRRDFGLRASWTVAEHYHSSWHVDVLTSGDHPGTTVEAATLVDGPSPLWQIRDGSPLPSATSKSWISSPPRGQMSRLRNLQRKKPITPPTQRKHRRSNLEAIGESRVSRHRKTESSEL